MKKYLPYLLFLSAISISITAAYYSIFGLSKLFSGAEYEVIVMASSLEIAKVVLVSFIYRYWSDLSKMLKSYLTVAVCILILITSMGIYGFLSSAYQDTANKFNIENKSISLLETKKQRYEETKQELSSENEQIVNDINNMRSGLSTGQQIQYKDKDGNLITTTSSAARKSLEKELDIANERRASLTSKIDVLNDSITNLELQILNSQTNSDVSSELGPLIYLSKITGWEMDKIVNILLLVIVFVFDPLGIAMLTGANTIFEKTTKLISQPTPEPEEPKEEEIPEIIEEEPEETIDTSLASYIEGLVPDERTQPIPEIVQEPKIVVDPAPVIRSRRSLTESQLRDMSHQEILEWLRKK